MKAEEFLKLATKGTEAGEVIKDNYLTEAIIKLLNNYADIRVKNCSISDVGGSFLYELKTIAYGKGSCSERMEEMKEKLSSK